MEGVPDESVERWAVRRVRATRNRLLEAAAVLVQERGLHGFTFDDVASAAGVSRATAYRQFPGRLALLKGLLLRYSPLEPVVTTIERMRDQPPAEVMPALARTAVRVVDENRGLLLSLISDVARLDEEVLETIRYAAARAAAVAVPYLLAQIAARRLRPVHPVLALQAFIGPLFVHVVTRPTLGALPLPGALPSLEEAAEQLAAGWLRAYAA